MFRDRQFVFKIEGKDVSPSTVTVKQLYEVLEALQRVIASTATNDVRSSDEKYLLSLVDVNEGSDSLTIATSPAMMDASVVVTQSIADDDFQLLSPGSKIGLHKLWKYSKRLDWTFQFFPNDDGVVFAEINPDKEICANDLARGTTEIMVQCQRVGGRRPSTAKVQLVTGESMTVTLKNQDQARDLGHLLYELVVLKGKATWDSTKWQLVDFEVDEIMPYRRRNSQESFNKLRELSGDIWDDIDPDEYSYQARSDSFTW